MNEGRLISATRLFVPQVMAASLFINVLNSEFFGVGESDGLCSFTASLNHSHRNQNLPRAYRKLQISKSNLIYGVLSFGGQMWAAGRNVKLSYLLLNPPPHHHSLL